MSDDLSRLERDLGTIPLHSARFVNKALTGTAMEAKKAWQELTRSSTGATKHFPRSIDFDVEGNWPEYRAEVGPNLGRMQGALGILEDSPGGVTAPPKKARPRVVKAVEKDFERGLDKAIDDALRRAGL